MKMWSSVTVASYTAVRRHGTLFVIDSDLPPAMRRCRRQLKILVLILIERLMYFMSGIPHQTRKAGNRIHWHRWQQRQDQWYQRPVGEIARLHWELQHVRYKSPLPGFCQNDIFHSASRRCVFWKRNKKQGKCEKVISPKGPLLAQGPRV